MAAAALLVLPRLPGRAGAPLASERIDTVPGGAVPVRVVDGTLDRGDLAAASVFADLQDYWAQQLVTVFGVRFEALRSGYTAIDAAGGTGGALCVPDPASAMGNALYCPTEDGIVFDAGVLVPILLDLYGTPALAASLAHEFGHAIQARVGPSPSHRNREPTRFPPVLIEAQADCYAGAFLAWVVAGEAARTHLTEPSLLQAVAPLLDFRDPVDAAPGSVAHGLGLDRLRSVLDGFKGGAATCRAMTIDSLDLTLGRIRAPADERPRFADDAAALRAAGDSLRTFGDPARIPAPDPADLSVAARYGQFATATAVALAAGQARFGNRVGAACFAGAWTASVYGRSPARALGSWPGDPDEALDLVRNRPGATFDDLTAFADGFTRGVAMC